MKSFEYFKQAQAVLRNVALDIDDLGDYDGTTQRWVEAAAKLKNPRTQQNYSPKELDSIVAARMYFKEFRKLSGFEEKIEETDSSHNGGKNLVLNRKRIEQEKKLAALGFSEVKISKILHIHQTVISRHGFSKWKKSGELKDEI